MYSSHSQDPTRRARIENEKQGSRQSIMIQQGETDDVGVSPRPTEKPDARSWAHFVAGGYVNIRLRFSKYSDCFNVNIENGSC